MTTIIIDSSSSTESLQLGYRFGALLQPGEVVTLWGDLGAGKTLFTRGIARGMGVPEAIPVTSPTFTYINEYDGSCHLYHLDLYRLGHPDELESLPWREALFGSGVAVIEWPDRLADRIPANRWDVAIEITGEMKRRFTIRALGTIEAGRAQSLADRLPGAEI